MNEFEAHQDVKSHWTIPLEPEEMQDVEREQCCFLCQSVNRTLTVLFNADVSSMKLRKLIHKYLKIKMNHLDETNGFVCVDCIERLNSLRWFDHQGRKNDLFLKNLPEELFLQGESYCRLCLCTTSRLQAIFLENDQTPNNPLCELIKECIGVEIDYYRDFTSNLCTLCRTQLEMFVTFKRISRQIHDEGTNANTNEEQNEFWEPLEKCKSSCSDADEPLLEVMSYEYEETSKKKRKRKVKNRTQKIKKQPTPKKQQAESNDNNDIIWAKTDRQRIYRILWTADDERNFEVIKEMKGRARIRRDGYTFSFANMKPDGSSLWNCDYRTLHSCKFQLTVGANGKIATVTKTMVHTHDSEPARILKSPLGKGVLLNDDGTEDVFWLIGVRHVGKEIDRHLIFRGHHYILRACDVSQDTSQWICKCRQCRVTVEVRGVFKFITSKGVHTHPQISKRELQEALKGSRVSARSEDVITPFRDQKVSEMDPKMSSLQRKLSVPEVYTKLAKEDEYREFIVLKARDNLYKIRYLGYDYKLYLKQTEGSTLWKCLWESIYNCKAVIVVSGDGRNAAYYGLVEHNHSIEPAPIFLCEPKQYSVRNIANDVLEYMKLLSRECAYFRSRTILFRFHVYNLYQIINDETRWLCVRTGSQGQQCSASIIITGSMESFLRKGDHCHLPMSTSEIKSIVKPGNVVELSALKHDESSQSANTTDSGSSNDVLNMLKQQLLAFPVGRGGIWDMKENKNHPFYFVMDQAKKSGTPYKFFYQHYRYAFVSIDEYGTSQWICCKLLETSAREGTCTARATIEGVFQRVLTRGTHNHDGIPESMVEYLCSKTETSI